MFCNIILDNNMQAVVISHSEVVVENYSLHYLVSWL